MAMSNDRTVDQRLDAIESGQDEIRADVAELKDGQKRLETRVGNLEAGQEKLEAGQEELRAGQKELSAGQKRLETRVGNLETGQQKLEAGQEELRAGQKELGAGQKRLETRVSNLEAGQQKLEAGQQKLEAGQEELRAGQQKLEAGQQKLESGQGELEAGQQKLEAGQQKLEAGQGELRAGQQKLEAGQERHENVQQELREGQARLERAVEAIRHDIAPLKAAHARNSALRVSYRICEDLGLDEVRILPRDELRAMMRRTDTAAIPRSQRHSFIEADAIIEAVDDAGETHYVALEASFTADERDTSRAIRNAGYLTQFTGRPAHAVIAAIRIDNRIAGDITAGAVRWCRLDENDLEIE